MFNFILQTYNILSTFPLSLYVISICYICGREEWSHANKCYGTLGKQHLTFVFYALLTLNLSNFYMQWESYGMRRQAIQRFFVPKKLKCDFSEECRGTEMCRMDEKHESCQWWRDAPDIERSKLSLVAEFASHSNE